jgi:hypothetical protein
MVHYKIYFYLTRLPFSCLFLFRKWFACYIFTSYRNNLQNYEMQWLQVMIDYMHLTLGFTMPCWYGATGCIPGLIDEMNFAWIRKRKVVYIPKKPQPTSPPDYRPLSMLEVLYKIPSRILARRLNQVLPTIIGPHQHGFMAQKGVQYKNLPYLLPTSFKKRTTITKVFN